MIQNDALQFPLASKIWRIEHAKRPKTPKKNCNELFQLFNFRFDIERTESSSFFVSFHSFFASFFFALFAFAVDFPFVGHRKMALYKHHLRSSVRFFIAPQATNQRQAYRELSSPTLSPTPSSSASAHETSKEKQLSPTRHSPYTRHNQTVDWLQFCIFTNFRFCNARRMWHEQRQYFLCLTSCVGRRNFRAKAKVFLSPSRYLNLLSLCVAHIERKPSWVLFRPVDEIMLAQLSSDTLRRCMLDRLSHSPRSSPLFDGSGYNFVGIGQITHEAHKKYEYIKPERK